MILVSYIPDVKKNLFNFIINGLYNDHISSWIIYPFSSFNKASYKQWQLSKIEIFNKIDFFSSYLADEFLTDIIGSNWSFLEPKCQ